MSPGGYIAEQGNRTSKALYERSQGIVASASRFEFATIGAFVGVGLDNAQSAAAQGGEIGWGVVFSGAVLVIVHHDIKRPMQAIFDLPVTSYRSGRGFGCETPGQQTEPLGLTGFSALLSAGGDVNEGVQMRP